MPQPDTSAWTAGPAPDVSAWTPGPAAASQGQAGSDPKPPDYTVKNEKDSFGQAVVRGASGAWNWANTPLVPQIADAAHAIADHIDAPKIDRSTTVAQIRGFLAGATDAAGKVAAGFTSPAGLALTLAGLGEDSALVGQIPGLKSLLALPEVKTLQRAVQAAGGGAFAVHGADRIVEAPTAGGKLQGAAEMAAGVLGVSSALQSRVPARPAASSLTPQEAASNAFAEAQGIPLDAATATGSKTLRAAQKRVANSYGGEGTAEALIQQQQSGLTTAGATLADQAHPNAASPETAGTAIQDALAATVKGHESTAEAAYGRAEPIASKVPIDLVGVKKGLTPLYTTLKRESVLVPLQGGKARALTALDRLMNGPDQVSLMDAERATSDLGALAGSPDVLRTPGQAAAAQAFSKLRTTVDTTAARTSPRLLSALQEGRAATRAKYAVNDVLESLSEEPVQAFKTLAAPKDLNITALRQVQQAAPAAVPTVARGYLEQLLDQATERGRFDHSDKLYADWQKLGTETKKVLFPQPGQREALDQFFLLAKRISENPNPSGTAHTLTALNFGSTPATWALSKLLYTPRGVAALTRVLAGTGGRASGATLAAASRTAGWAELTAVAHAAGVPLAVPRAASTDSTGESR